MRPFPTLVLRKIFWSFVPRRQSCEHSAGLRPRSHSYCVAGSEDKRLSFSATQVALAQPGPTPCFVYCSPLQGRLARYSHGLRALRTNSLFVSCLLHHHPQHERDTLSTVLPLASMDAASLKKLPRKALQRLAKVSNVHFWLGLDVTTDAPRHTRPTASRRT